LNLIHDGEAVDFELAGGDGFHWRKLAVIMVIIPWS
jgi:hypothetical protein